MQFLSHISMRSRLLLLIASAAAGVLLVNAISVLGMRQTAQQTRALVADDLPTLRQTAVVGD